MGRSFLYLAVQKTLRCRIEVFQVSATSDLLFNMFEARSIQNELVDLDRSLLFDVGSDDAAKGIRERLHPIFAKFSWSNQLRVQTRRSMKEAQPDDLTHYAVTDHEARNVLDKYAQYILDNRVPLGDEGHWQKQSLREYILKRPWTSLSDAMDEAPSASKVAALHFHADYCDEVASFRLPSISVLAGHAQPLGALRGQKVFETLFLKDGAGVYLVFDGEEILYVGMTQCFSRRLMNANAHHKLRIAMERHPEAHVALIHYPVAKVAALRDAVTSAEREAAWCRIRELIFGLERACIGFYQPQYNGALALAS